MKNTERIIESDIKKIKNELSNSIEKIGLFGSSLTVEFEETNDIDLVIYCNENYEIVRKNLLNLKLEFPICPHKMNGSYGFKEFDTDEKHYHIILLNNKKPNVEFERINKGKIKEL